LLRKYVKYSLQIRGTPELIQIMIYLASNTSSTYWRCKT